MPAFQAAQEFISEAEEATAIAELRDRFTAFIQKLGFDYVACISLPGLHGSLAGRVHLVTYPEAWAAHYLAEDFQKYDRIFEVTKTEILPFDWTDPRLRTGLTPIQRRMFDEAKEAGLRHGISVPIHHPTGPPGSVSVAGANSDVDPAALHSVHLAAIYLFDALQRLENQDDGAATGRLSPRERECLSWVALGKSDWSIGEILGVAESTAHFHIERAKTKLGVSTRIQAVVRAFMTNQIIP